MPPSNTQFSIAVHLMSRLGFEDSCQVKSRDLALSINASPSFVRRILAKLSKAGLVKAKPGKAGACKLARSARDISLLDIYQAIGPFHLIALHDYPATEFCPVSCNIKQSMEKILFKAQKRLEEDLNKISLKSIIKDIKKNGR